MAAGQVPALFAIPAGIGDMLVGATSFWVARKFDEPGGRRRAIVFNVLGLTDLIVAVTLGVTTNPGPAQLFFTTPAATMLTQFPLTLVPTFLVPLAATLHVISLRQLVAGSWRRSSGSLARPRTRPTEACTRSESGVRPRSDPGLTLAYFFNAARMIARWW